MTDSGTDLKTQPLPDIVGTHAYVVIEYRLKGDRVFVHGQRFQVLPVPIAGLSAGKVQSALFDATMLDMPAILTGDGHYGDGAVRVYVMNSVTPMRVQNTDTLTAFVDGIVGGYRLPYLHFIIDFEKPNAAAGVIDDNLVAEVVAARRYSTAPKPKMVGKGTYGCVYQGRACGLDGVPVGNTVSKVLVIHEAIKGLEIYDYVKAADPTGLYSSALIGTMCDPPIDLLTDSCVYTKFSDAGDNPYKPLKVMINLSDVGRRMDTVSFEAASICQAMVYLFTGLQHFHAHQTYHFDLNTGNFCVDSTNRPRFIDFGGPAFFKEFLGRGIRSTYALIAPSYYLCGYDVALYTFVDALRNGLADVLDLDGDARTLGEWAATASGHFMATIPVDSFGDLFPGSSLDEIYPMDIIAIKILLQRGGIRDGQPVPYTNIYEALDVYALGSSLTLIISRMYDIARLMGEEEERMRLLSIHQLLIRCLQPSIRNRAKPREVIDGLVAMMSTWGDVPVLDPVPTSFL